MSKYTDKELLGRVRGWLQYASAEVRNEFGEAAMADAFDLRDSTLTGYDLYNAVNEHLGGNVQERITLPRAQRIWRLGTRRISNVFNLCRRRRNS